ncbi:MAG: serine/threonine-protein phosphatase, partial [Anaerolineae bacterium]|nr:serine/threonine-protein phosphatase [Anaerolineae bacterium]
RMLELAQERLQELIGGQYLEPIELINVALTLSTLIGLDNLGASGSNGQLPDIAGLEVGLYYKSASMPSGDFFDFIPLDNGSWGIIIGDVADKGLPAILYARSCRMLLRVIAQRRSDPVEALQQLNHILLTGQSSMFITVWMGIWRPATSTLVYAKGGHNPPFIVRAAQQEAEHLNTKGVAIGFFDGIQLDREETQLLDGDVLTVFTDGIVEASSPQDVDFGETRLEALCRSNRLLSAQAIADLIGKEVQKHTAGSKRYDDAIAIVLRRV